MSNIIEKEKRNENTSHLHTFNSIGSKNYTKGNYPLALQYYHKALAIMTALKGKESLDSVPIHRELGSVYKAQ